MEICIFMPSSALILCCLLIPPHRRHFWRECHTTKTLKALNAHHNDGGHCFLLPRPALSRVIIIISIINIKWCHDKMQFSYYITAEMMHLPSLFCFSVDRIASHWRWARMCGSLHSGLWHTYNRNGCISLINIMSSRNNHWSEIVQPRRKARHHTTIMTIIECILMASTRESASIRAISSSLRPSSIIFLFTEACILE